MEKLSNAKYLKKIDFDFSDTKIKRRQNKYGYLQYMDRTGSRYRCIVYAERLGAVLGSEYVSGTLCLNTRHRAVAKLDQHLFEFVENLRTDGSGKQLTALRGEGSKKRSPSKTAVDLADGSNIETYLYKPSGKGPYPAVIVLPVRGGMNEYSKDFSDELSRAGYVTLTVNFRTGSGWPDAKIGATYDYLQKLPEVDPQRIGMVGFSKGGELGLETIIDWGNGFPPRPIRAMVSYYLGSNLRFPQSDDPPILFLHGDKDHRTQWQEVVAFCEESRKADRVCEYKIYKDTYHSFTHSPSNYSPFAERDAYKRTVAFLNKHLRDAPIQ